MMKESNKKKVFKVLRARSAAQKTERKFKSALQIQKCIFFV